MKRKIKVAAIQMEIKMLDIQANLDKAQKMLKELFKDQKYDLVVFPEDFITGPIPNNLDLTQDENSPSIKLFKKLAVLYNTHIVCGSIIKNIERKHFNTSFLINNKGEIILEYYKNNLWHPERKYLMPGNNISIVKTPIGNIGIIICWDIAFPEMCRKLIKLGADIICCPSYWTRNDGGILVRQYKSTETEKNFVNAICPARAMENGVLFIYCNAAGQARVKLKSKIWSSPQIGQSQICVPIFGTVAKIEDNKEGFVTYEFDRKIIKDSERQYKIKKDLGTHL